MPRWERATEQEVALLGATDGGFDSRQRKGVKREEAEEWPGRRCHTVIEAQVRTGAGFAVGRGRVDGSRLRAVGVRTVEQAVERGAEVVQRKPRVEDKVDAG